jgi:integrase
VHKLSKHDFEDLRVGFRKKYSATRTNGMITVVREMMELAAEEKMISKGTKQEIMEGFLFVEVDYDYKRMTIELPETPVVFELRDTVYRRCANAGSDGGWLFDFLLSSGSRIEAANDVLKMDYNPTRRTLFFRNAKYGNYEIPVNPSLQQIIEMILKRRPNLKPTDRLLPTKSLQTVLTHACQELRDKGRHCPHLAHHDLRHIFATWAIEQGVDWVTLAAWLGHRDNGRTAMLIYGHLRQKHSQSEAARMKFLPAAEAGAPTAGTGPKIEATPASLEMASKMSFLPNGEPQVSAPEAPADSQDSAAL